MGDNNLAKLRSLVEVARALQNSLSTQEVLTAVVDAALAVTGCERGFLLLRKGDSLEVSVSRDLAGQPLDAGDLRVPTAGDPARAELAPRAAVDVVQSGNAGDARRDRPERGRAGTAQRRVRAAGAGAKRVHGRNPDRFACPADRGAAVSGFAPFARGSLGGKSRGAADAGDRGVDDSRKRAADGRPARQAAHGERAENRARYPAGLGAGVAAQRRMVSRGRIELGVQRSRRRLFRRPAGIARTCGRRWSPMFRGRASARRCWRACCKARS